jgi:hypothetical protein
VQLLTQSHVRENEVDEEKSRETGYTITTYILKMVKLWI